MIQPVHRFIEDMARLGLRPRLEADIVLYSVEPVDGARAGAPVETGVSGAELARWPEVPPHWVHLPDDVKLARTNSRPSIRSGWTMHSRQISEWGRERDPALCWVSHVRGILSEATS